MEIKDSGAKPDPDQTGGETSNTRSTCRRHDRLRGEGIISDTSSGPMCDFSQKVTCFQFMPSFASHPHSICTRAIFVNKDRRKVTPGFMHRTNDEAACSGRGGLCTYEIGNNAHKVSIWTVAVLCVQAFMILLVSCRQHIRINLLDHGFSASSVHVISHHTDINT